MNMAAYPRLKRSISYFGGTDLIEIAPRWIFGCSYEPWNAERINAYTVQALRLIAEI